MQAFKSSEIVTSDSFCQYNCCLGRDGFHVLPTPSEEQKNKRKM